MPSLPRIRLPTLLGMIRYLRCPPHAQHDMRGAGQNVVHDEAVARAVRERAARQSQRLFQLGRWSRAVAHG